MDEVVTCWYSMQLYTGLSRSHVEPAATLPGAVVEPPPGALEHVGLVSAVGGASVDEKRSGSQLVGGGDAASPTDAAL